MITLTIVLILAYLYGAIVFYKTVVKEAQWNVLEIKQTFIQWIMSGLFFVSTIIGGLILFCLFMKLIVESMIKYLP